MHPPGLEVGSKHQDANVYEVGLWYQSAAEHEIGLLHQDSYAIEVGLQYQAAAEHEVGLPHQDSHAIEAGLQYQAAAEHDVGMKYQDSYDVLKSHVAAELVCDLKHQAAEEHEVGLRVQTADVQVVDLKYQAADEHEVDECASLLSCVNPWQTFLSAEDLAELGSVSREFYHIFVGFYLRWLWLQSKDERFFLSGDSDVGDEEWMSD